MRVKLAIVFAFVAMPCLAMPQECELRNFPDFWADAQSQVEKLRVLLDTAERGNPYAMGSAKPFRQALAICESKRKSVFNDPKAGSGSAGVSSQMKCEAALICSRLLVMESRF
jgi:hypothetical protein